MLLLEFLTLMTLYLGFFPVTTAICAYKCFLGVSVEMEDFDRGFHVDLLNI